MQVAEGALFTLKHLNTQRTAYEIPEALYSSLPYTLHLEEAKLYWGRGEHPLAVRLLKSLLQTFTGVCYHDYHPLCSAGLSWLFIALCVISSHLPSLLLLLPPPPPFFSSKIFLQRLPPSIPLLSVSMVTGWRKPTQKVPPSS